MPFEMTYDIYRYIFIGAAVLSGVMLLVSLLLFIFLRIPKVISDLSGATARKAIKSIREQNEATGDKTYRVSSVNKAGGRVTVTDKISPSGTLIRRNQEPMVTGVVTAKIDTLRFPGQGEETTLLSEQTGAGETAVLMDSGSAGETAVLSETASEAGAQAFGSAADGVSIEYEITYIHTDEIIEMEVMV